jgi:hypothetical protein
VNLPKGEQQYTNMSEVTGASLTHPMNGVTVLTDASEMQKETNK